MAHVRKGDLVVVTKGKYKGKKGTILRVVGQRVVVEKINMVKRHSKPSQQHQQGGIIEKEGTVAISNVLLWDEKAGRGVRTKMVTDGKSKVRVSVKTGTKFAAAKS
jgi:large subunit ribosomal protein L24